MQSVCFLVDFLWNSSFIPIEFGVKEKIPTKTIVDVSRGTGGRVFPFFSETLGGGQQEPIFSSKAVPEDLIMKFRSKLNHGFTNRGCLHCAILKTYKARDMQFSLQNVQNQIFKILKMFNKT